MWCGAEGGGGKQPHTADRPCVLLDLQIPARNSQTPQIQFQINSVYCAVYRAQKAGAWSHRDKTSLSLFWTLRTLVHCSHDATPVLNPEDPPPLRKLPKAHPAQSRRTDPLSWVSPSALWRRTRFLFHFVLCRISNPSWVDTFIKFNLNELPKSLNK